MATPVKPTRPNEATPAHRFEATLDPATRARSLATVEDLALDRLPDVDGKVRLLLTADHARELLSRGFQIHLLGTIPVAPLDPSLVMTDKQSAAALEAQLKGIPRKGGQ
jgi:hypothetical protein